MSCLIYIVDAFTNGPFTGNPAAVCILTGRESPQWMQNVAAEMNLSETAFTWHLQTNEWVLRWFTPSREVNLCGHACNDPAEFAHSGVRTFSWTVIQTSTLGPDDTRWGCGHQGTV